MDANDALAAIAELEKWIEHDAEDHGVKPSVAESEPVVISHLVTTGLMALVGWGWVAIPVPAIHLISAVVALAVIAGVAVAARNKVTPSANWEDTIKSMVSDVVADELAKLAPKE